MIELRYEIDLRRAKNFEIKHVRADSNSLFSAIASQVFGDYEMYYLRGRFAFFYGTQSRALFSACY
uniref:Uncharacterized protein n=1 Tax=Kalanchoe fedtschenkoi TaxID=63787 RepID=A0A7N1A2V8_KALFE